MNKSVHSSQLKQYLDVCLCVYNIMYPVHCIFVYLKWQSLLRISHKPYSIIYVHMNVRKRGWNM